MNNKYYDPTDKDRLLGEILNIKPLNGYVPLSFSNNNPVSIFLDSFISSFIYVSTSSCSSKITDESSFILLLKYNVSNVELFFVSIFT